MDGIFDLFHTGHAKALEQGKKLFPTTYLIVGCCNDELTIKNKGMVVMNENDRYESLRHCKWVDEVLTDAPWTIDESFLEKHSIDYVAHDAVPYSCNGNKDIYSTVKELGKFKEIQRTEGVSTSDIITKIIRNYNNYVVRNVMKGQTRHELGISYLKFKEIMLKHELKELKDFTEAQFEELNKMVEKYTEKYTKAFETNTQKIEREIEEYMTKCKTVPYWKSYAVIGGLTVAALWFKFAAYK